MATWLDNLLGRNRGPLSEIEERTERLARRIKQLTKLMATQADLAAEVAAKTAQVRKAIDEITIRLAALEEAVRNAPVTPELQAAVAALGVAVQAADDITPDVSVPTP